MTLIEAINAIPVWFWIGVGVAIVFVLLYTASEGG